MASSSRFSEVQQSWKKLQKCQIEPVKISRLQEEDETVFSHLSQDILNVKAKRLQAELSVVSDSSITYVTGTNDDQFEIFTKNLQKDLKELQETHSCICEQNKELTNAESREEEICKQLESVEEVLQKRFQEHEENTKHRDGFPARQRDEIATKITKGGNYLKQVIKQLGKFVDTQFPLPSEQTFKDGTKKLRSTDRKMTHKNMISLKEILEELMNKCFDEPNDPYVVIDHRFWPPYVELLLRCQIVLRHQDDANKLRLVPFHL